MNCASPNFPNEPVAQCRSKRSKILVLGRKATFEARRHSRRLRGLFQNRSGLLSSRCRRSNDVDKRTPLPPSLSGEENITSRANELARKALGNRSPAGGGGAGRIRSCSGNLQALCGWDNNVFIFSFSLPLFFVPSGDFDSRSRRRRGGSVN